jgi:hypothetical protein
MSQFRKAEAMIARTVSGCVLAVKPHARNQCTPAFASSPKHPQA